jgi:uncharacterized protein (PEP-CTERM system associated)
VRLEPEGQENTDIVLTATPELSLLRYGTRTFTRIDYRPTLYFYVADPADTRVRNYLNALFSLEAVENFFFVDLRARMEQSFFSPFEAGTWDSVADVDNQLQNTSLMVSPYILGEFGGGYRYLVRNDNYWSTTDRSSLPGQMENRLRARLDSPTGPRFDWSADYNFRRNEFQDTDAFYEQQARLIARYRVHPDLQVSARGGYETNDYSTDSYSGAIYGGGLDWTPTPRTSINGYAEHRFFGTGYQANLSHRRRITSLRVRGSRDTSTYREQVFALPAGDTRELLDATFSSRIPDPIDREQAVQDFLRSSGLPATLDGPVTYFTNRIYVLNRVDASIGLFGARNALTFNAFYRDSEAVSPTPDDPLPDVFALASRVEQRGAQAALSHNLSARSAVTLSVRRTLTETTDPEPGLPVVEATENLYRLTYNRWLSARTSGAVGLRYVDFDSDRPNSSYQERAVFVAVSHRFF